MEQKKIFELLDNIRECATCTDIDNCQEYLFTKLAEEEILKEHELESSFTARLLARSLAWMAVEETSMMCNLDEADYNDAKLPPPLPGEQENIDEVDDMLDDEYGINGPFGDFPFSSRAYINSVRQQMRETIKMLLDMKIIRKRSKTEA